MSGDFDIVKRYPWLPSLEKYYSNIASKNPIDFIKDIFNSKDSDELQKRALIIFETAFQNIEEISEYQPDDINIYLYLLLKILLYVLNNKIISNRIGNLYSKITYSEMNKENEYNLYYIYRDLNLDIIFDQNPTTFKRTIIKDQQEIVKTKFKIHFVDYLNLTAKMLDESRKLVNNALSNGYIYLQTKSLNRLIQEYVRLKFSNLNEKINDELKSFKEKLLEIQGFSEIYERISDFWETRKEEFEYKFEVDITKDKGIAKNLPPCIQEILSKLKEGQNLVHTERLYIVWFLNALKYSEEEIINIFTALPDFDRDRTGYQVRFAIKKGYTPYSCKTLKTYSLCSAKKFKDKLCLEGYFSRKLDIQKQISHPLFYVQYKQFVSMIKKENKQKFTKTA
ncbi:hypothetical protein LCGC14_1325500 [marine sediment metagenome]|uniref:DNA primase large subunit C-terminal domain-containing protein n=1 Tax=marine sediment metagenome TaxID=412755 RepID=A0A0F9KIU0_9ZZZZ